MLFKGKSKKEQETVFLIEQDGKPEKEARTVFLIGKITEDTTRSFITGFHYLDHGKGKITVILSCIGGNDDWGWAIYDTITCSRNKVIIKAYGPCQSMSAVVLQAGDKRLVSPQSTFMIHNGSVEMASEQDRLPNVLKHLQNETGRYHKVLSQRSGVSIKDIQKLCQNETFMDANKTVSMGFADEIIKTRKVI